MRTLTALLSLVCVSLAAAAGPRVTAEQAAGRRGQLVTLVGPVTEVQQRPDGMVLMVGTEPRVAVVVPRSALGSFPRDLTALHQKTIEVSGFVTPKDEPLALVLQQPDRLAVPPSANGVEEQHLQDRIRALEDEVTRLRAQTQAQPLQLITYGPGRPTQSIQPYALQGTVRAERGVPDRVAWGSHGGSLYYGRTRYTFDADGQLIGTRTR